MSESPGKRIAIVGAGPAGLYALQAALRLPDVVGADVFDMLPAPYGLVRYGVAADHAKTKSVVRVFQKELEKEHVRFFGNVTFGVDVHRDDLRRHYDAVVYSTGARHDRDLGVPGEELPGNLGAADFVSWYSGHPDAETSDILHTSTAVAVVGAGNVALDVTRVLAKDAQELHETDMPDAVVEVLATSTVQDIHLLARRGPAQAKFTSIELRELGELANADVIVDPDEVGSPDDPLPDDAEPAAKVNLSVLREWATRPLAGKPRRIHLHFWTSVDQVLGEERVRAVRLRRSSGAPPASGGQFKVLQVQAVIRAIGYLSRALPEVPFDAGKGVVPNDLGRVRHPETEDPTLGREYVAGWLKRGPSGVIGTNRGDATETVATMAEDLGTAPPRQVTDPDALPRILAERGVRVVDWEGWKRLEAFEAALGAGRGATSIKVADREKMLEICLPLVTQAPAESGAGTGGQS